MLKQHFFSGVVGGSVAYFLCTTSILATPKTTLSNQADDLLPIAPIKNQWLTSQSENSSSPPKQEEKKPAHDTKSNSDYIEPPEVVPAENVPPFITSVSLSAERQVNHLTDWNVNTRYLFSDDRSENLEVSAIAKLDAKVVNSLSQDNVFRADFQGDYFELKTVEQERIVTTTFKEPQTLNGLILQQTFTGDCSVLDIETDDPNQQCSFLPTLVSDPDSIDPTFLIPTKIDQGNPEDRVIGEPISEETLANLKQPGFQNTTADGDPIGIDLDFPNAGGLPGNTQSNETDVERREDFDLTYSGRYYNTRQVVKANHERAVLGRTVRGLGIIGDEENIFLNAAVQGAGQLLPDVIPELEGSEKPANTNVNQNLFLAANNTRIPKDSFVIYQGGIGSSDSRSPESEESQSPNAKFNSVWLGLSPVVDRSLETEIGFELLGDRQVVARAGAEGGADTDIDFSAAVDDIEVTTDSPNLKNFYIQNFVTLTEQDVDFVTEERFIEETSYYPHLSLTGNITGDDRAFRYYSGVIASEEAKVYLGGDYTQSFNGWRVNLAAIGYTNPDKDYFSKTEGLLGKQWQLAEDATLKASAGFRYVFDRPEEDVLDDPIDNNVNVGVTLNVDRFTFNLRQLFDVFPNSTGNQLRASVGVNVTDNIALNAYLIPERNIDNFGVTGEYKFPNGGIFKSLIVSWDRSVFDFGEDPFDNELKEANDTFSVLLNFSGS